MISLFRVLISLFMFGTLCSCIVPESTHVNPTFHLLSKTTFDQNETVTAFPQIEDGNNSDIGFPFYLRQVEIPYYLQERSNLEKTTAGESLLSRESVELWG
jgi:hypothetical protein